MRVWEAKTGRQVQICQGHDSFVNSVSWSHDDRFLASASFDETVRVWDRSVMSNDESSAYYGTRAEQKKDASSPNCKDKGTHILPKKCKLALFIGSWNGLILKDVDFSGAVGLSDMNKRLIKQRGGKV
ncbi:MAG: hypothetical protein AAF900_02220 [Bacteroidota bacterium]